MKEKRKLGNLYPEKTFFKNEGKIIFQTYKRPKTSSPAHLYHSKGNPLGRRKMITDEILDPHK